MNKAFLQCHAGASGDMFLSVLVDAGWDFNDLTETIARLKLPRSSYALEKHTRFIQGVKTTHIEVKTDRENKLRHLHDIEKIILSSTLSQQIKEGSLATFRILAEAEAAVHGKSIDEIHFHEIGALDTIIDIVGAIAGFSALNIQEVICSPIRVGKGFIQCEHGTMPIPAPATAKLIAGLPVYAGEEEGEFLTPTGAAIIKKIATSYSDLPLGLWECVGYGSGSRITAVPNYLRLFIAKAQQSLLMEKLVLLETNLDDQTGQSYGFIFDRIWEAGPLDVYYTPIQMKKNRPGVKLSILTTPDNYQNVITILMKEGFTLGLRVQEIGRISLPREEKEIDTEFGPVRVKFAYFQGQICRRVPEYEDCRKIAAEKGIPLWQVMETVAKKSADL